MTTLSPFDFWAGLWRSGMEAAQTGLRMTEMLAASAEVVESRCGTAAAALRDPLHGDYRELARMVPEKVEAFARAGTSVWHDLAALQASSLAGWSHAAGLLASGRFWSAQDGMALWNRSGEMVSRSMGMSGRALVPVHRTATANARRLRRQRKS